MSIFTAWRHGPSAPAWATHRRAEILAELEDWCRANQIPLTIFEENEELAEVAAPPVAPAVVVVPSNFTAFAPLVILVLVICGGFWLMFGEPFLRYRIVGTWGTATVPHVNLTIFRDGRYELGPTDPRYGAIRKGRWQLHGTELELVGPESTQRHSIRLSSGRSIRAHTLWLGHVRYEVRRDRP